MLKHRILVLDADSNAGLAVVQSLGAAGCELVVGASKRNGPAFSSRWVRETTVYPDPMVDAPAFKAWMAEWIRHNDVALVIPVTECTLVPLHEMRDDAVLMPKVAMPAKEVLDRVLDKERLRTLAAELDIPVPASAIVTSADDLADDRMDEWMSEGAAVVRTIKSKVWKGDVAHEFPTVLVRSREELVKVVLERVDVVPVQVQQWVPGRGLGVELLAKGGTILMSMAHERLHEVPLTGGGSSYRRTIEMPADLFADAEKLIHTLAYEGVAMVEFRGDAATGRRWLVEINARFWGSLPLAIFAGADFPKALVELTLEGKLPAFTPAKAGIYARHLHRELEWLKLNLKRRGRFSPQELTRPLGPSLLEWTRVVRGIETWDGANLRDPVPLLAELRSVVGQELSSAAGKTRRAAVQTAARRTSLLRAKSFEPTKRVLFLCYGNICRSPYAEAKARAGATELQVRSVGFHDKVDRVTPEHVLEVARKRGVDLASHRSRRIDKSDLEWADMVILMDQRNYDDLARFDRAALRKVVWLGALDGGRIEIDDPYDLEEQAADAVLERMDRCLERLLGGAA